MVLSEPVVLFIKCPSAKDPSSRRLCQDPRVVTGASGECSETDEGDPVSMLLRVFRRKRGWYVVARETLTGGVSRAVTRPHPNASMGS